MTREPAAAPRPKPHIIMVPVALAAFITGLDNTVMNIALPALRADLGLGLSGLQWVVTSYILMFSSLLLVGGRLTDMLGRRRALVLGFVTFAAASLAAGLAPSGGALVAARIAQGAGAALILPSSMAIIASDLEHEARDLAAGVWTASIALALFVGPVVGGAISEYLHWSWIFFLNVPVAGIAISLVLSSIPSQPAVAPGSVISRLDPPGLVLSTLALLAVTYALVQGNEEGFGATEIIAAFIVAFVAAAAFMIAEIKVPHPLVDVSLFRNRVFAGGTVAQVLWGLSINGVFFFTSLFLQDSLGLPPVQAGLVFLPLAVTLVLGVAIAPKVVTLLGTNVTVAFGMVVIAVGLMPLVVVGHGAGAYDQVIACALVGLGTGLTTPLTSAVLAVLPEDHAGIGSAVVAVAREVSGVLGIAVIGAILAARQARSLAEGASPPDAFLDGHITGLIGAALLVLLGAIVSGVTLPRERDDAAAERIAPPAPVTLHPVSEPPRRAAR